MIRSLLNAQEASLRKKIKAYLEVADEVKAHLSKNPNDWGKFQSDFNIEVNGIFRDIMNFEKQSLAKGDEESVYKLKRIFVNHLRKHFLHGEYAIWSLKKPYGYAGDFKIIDDIYRNDPQTQGFDRLFDNYTQMSAMAIAIRNRKEDIKRFITSFIDSRAAHSSRLLDLAAGPCRDLKELFTSNSFDKEKITVDCYDHDQRAIDYAQHLLASHTAWVNFIRENVLRIALKKNIESQMRERYDLIYAMGLFDYLDNRIAVRLTRNLRAILNNEGKLIVANVREKYQNPSVHFLEWVGDWNLIYRGEEEFRQIFLDAGFKEGELQTESEQQGIIQYILATKAD